MFPIPHAQIAKATSQRCLRAGAHYLAEGRVSRLEILDGGTRLRASVKGTEPEPYDVSVALKRAKGRVLIHGNCSCYVGSNCKHVAAVLLGASTPTRRAEPADKPSLPREVTTWLAQLARAAVPETEEYPTALRKRLIYTLAPVPTRAGPPGLGIGLAGIEMRSDGTASATVKTYQLHNLLGAAPPAFLRPSDHHILRRLRANLDTEPAELEDLLRRILATGRARWGAPLGPALGLDEPLPGALTWQLGEDGEQTARLQPPAGTEAVWWGGPWYVDPAAGRIGRIALPLAIPVLASLITGPVLPPDAAAAVGDVLARIAPAHTLPPPRVLPIIATVATEPRPRLLLHATRMAPQVIGWGWRPEPVSAAAAALSFRYGELSVPGLSGRRLVARGDGLVEIRRDDAREDAAMAALQRAGFEPLGRLEPLPHPEGPGFAPKRKQDEAAWVRFLVTTVPKLRAQGWEIETGADFPYRVIPADSEFAAELSQGSGIDWLDLELGVTVEGQRVDLVPPLLAWLRQVGEGEPYADRDGLFRLAIGNGQTLMLPFARLRPILATLLELFGAGGLQGPPDRIRLRPQALGELDALEQAGLAAGLVWRGGEALRALARQLRERGGIPQAALPASFAATLRPYQARGVDWLQFLRAAGLSGVLADDMGLGKTVQTLAHLLIEKQAGRLTDPALVVCPTSLVANWRLEAARFAPSLRVLTLHGPDRKARFGEISSHDLVITTYPLLPRDQEALTAPEWHLLVLDEAQMIKNPATITALLARKLRARQRICLSGTPLENHLGELWSLFEFLLPGFLGDRQDFARRFRTPIEKSGDEARRSALVRRVSPFLLRRAKHEVLLDLPPRTEITEAVEMGAGQRAVYDGIRLAMHSRVRAAIAEQGLARSGIIILDALLKLRQACCDPRLLKLSSTQRGVGSAKLDRLMEMLPQLLDEGRRILLFSQFTSMLALIEPAITAAGIAHVKLTGDTRDRATPIEAFQSGAVPLFLISLKAGGVGLNLAAADTVIHYDPWWNPAVEDQATSRAHRIGQTRPVFVHRLVTQGTIEEKMEVLKARKQALVASILEGTSERALAMTEADVELLFAA